MVPARVEPVEPREREVVAMHLDERRAHVGRVSQRGGELVRLELEPSRQHDRRLLRQLDATSHAHSTKAVHVSCAIIACNYFRIRAVNQRVCDVTSKMSADEELLLK